MATIWLDDYGVYYHAVEERIFIVDFSFSVFADEKGDHYFAITPQVKAEIEDGIEEGIIKKIGSL